MTIKEAFQFLVRPPTSGPKATLVIRLMAGGVFFWEGLLKFAYANQGIGRFTKLGLPVPHVLAPAIAVLEIGGGLMLMSGLGTRLISIPFIVEMVVAMLSTKIGVYFGTSPFPSRRRRRRWELGPSFTRFAPTTRRSCLASSCW